MADLRDGSYVCVRCRRGLNCEDKNCPSCGCTEVVPYGESTGPVKLFGGGVATEAQILEAIRCHNEPAYMSGKLVTQDATGTHIVDPKLAERVLVPYKSQVAVQQKFLDAAIKSLRENFVARPNYPLSVHDEIIHDSVGAAIGRNTPDVVFTYNHPVTGQLMEMRGDTAASLETSIKEQHAQVSHVYVLPSIGLKCALCDRYAHEAVHTIERDTKKALQDRKKDMAIDARIDAEETRKQHPTYRERRAAWAEALVSAVEAVNPGVIDAPVDLRPLNVEVVGGYFTSRTMVKVEFEIQAHRPLVSYSRSYFGWDW